MVRGSEQGRGKYEDEVGDTAEFGIQRRLPTYSVCRRLLPTSVGFRVQDRDGENDDDNDNGFLVHAAYSSKRPHLVFPPSRLSRFMQSACTCVQTSWTDLYACTATPPFFCVYHSRWEIRQRLVFFSSLKKTHQKTESKQPREQPQKSNSYVTMSATIREIIEPASSKRLPLNMQQLFRNFDKSWRQQFEIKNRLFSPEV